MPKGTFYCDCVQPSMQKPISETEYECFDCGKEVKQIICTITDGNMKRLKLPLENDKK